MKILTVLAATAVAAAVAAAITIPAGADEGGGSQDGFAACLRAEGLDIPAGTRGDEIKQWALRQPQGAVLERAFAACKPKGESPKRLVECLRGEGLEPPAAIDELKPWIGRELETEAGKTTLRACGVDMAPKARPGVASTEKAACGDRPKEETVDAEQ